MPDSRNPPRDESSPAGAELQPADLRLDADDLVEVAGRIAGITDANLPLTPGLRALSEELPSRTLRRGLRVLCDRLEQGEPLEQALKSDGVAIPEHVRGLILTGVRTGRLGEILDWFLRHIRRQIHLRQRRRATLTYPAILIAAGLLVAAFTLTWVVPDVKRIYSDFGTQLPAMTIGLIATSDFAVNYGLPVLVGILTASVAVTFAFGVFVAKPFKHRVLAGTPFVGTMFRSAALAGFCELLRILVSGRLPLAEAVRLAGEGSGDADLGVRFREIATCLEQGQDDSQVFIRLANVSPQLVYVFHWKNREGAFVDALSSAVRIFENQARLQITLYGVVIEPIVIVGVLSGMGFVVASLFLPLIKLLNELS